MLAVFLYACACVRVRRRKMAKLMILCRYDGIEYWNIRFKALFSVIQREKIKNGIVIGYWQNKRSDGLKNAFCIF